MIIKRILKKILNEIKNIKKKLKFKDRIMNKYYYLFDKTLINKLAQNNILNIERFNVKKWHFGYRYYIGKYDNKKVFIKISNKVGIIKHEYEINEYIKQNSVRLKKFIPNVIMYKEYNRNAAIVEEFVEAKKICNIDFDISDLHRKKIYGQFIEIIEELHRIKLMHLDINEDNVYISNDCNVYITDFGYSLIKDKIDLSFIKTKKIADRIYSAINPTMRFESGYIDDAFSFMQLAKIIDFELMKNNKEYWYKLDGLIDKMSFKYREL